MQDFNSLYFSLQQARVNNLKWSQFLFNNQFSKQSISEQGGVYLFLSPQQLNGKYNVLYAGKSDNIQRRFGEHQVSFNRYINNSMYFIYSIETIETQRTFTETALIHIYDPPGNSQQKLA